jgi:uncharacterized protein (DUF2235 family)
MAYGSEANVVKRIVICLDGTWNKVAKPDEVTNVVKFAQSVQSVASDGVSQIVYYNSGVGTGGRVDRFLGGVFGAGLKSNVQRAYAFLTLNFVQGDEIYIVGFSRGAYTARALAAIVNSVGVLQSQEFERFEEAWEYYRVPPAIRRAERLRREGEADARGNKQKLGPEPATAHQQQAVKTIEDKRADWFRRTTVKALGVWDTVGSYGIPSGLAISGLAYNFTVRHLGFHDRQLGNNIENAFHAIALDEARSAFQPTLWTASGQPPKGNVEQVWFPGVHSDVGGGYKSTGLSDLALLWMMDRMVGTGLGIDAQFVRETVDPCPLCELHRSDSKFWRLLRPYRRQLFGDRTPIIGPDGQPETVINEKLHWCLAERLQGGGLFKGHFKSYEPSNLSRPIAGLSASTPGTFEKQILRSHRDRSSPWSGYHDQCWTTAIPENWPRSDSPNRADSEVDLLQRTESVL